MKSFSIKELASRIAQAQSFSRSAMADRIYGIQKRIHNVMEGVAKMQEFSRSLVMSKSPENEVNIKKLAAGSSNAEKVNRTQEIENVLTKKAEDSALTKLLNEGSKVLKNSLSGSSGNNIIPEMVPLPIKMLLNQKSLQNIFKANQSLDGKSPSGEKINLLIGDKKS